jgi:hypothetical protein
MTLCFAKNVQPNLHEALPGLLFDEIDFLAVRRRRRRFDAPSHGKMLEVVMERKSGKNINGCDDSHSNQQYRHMVGSFSLVQSCRWFDGSTLSGSPSKGFRSPL